MRCCDDNPTRIVGLQHSDGIGADQYRLAGNIAHDEVVTLGDAWRRGRRHDCRTHKFGAVPDAPARRAAQCGGSGIDPADDAMLKHVIAIADMACPCICSRRGQVDLVEIVKSDDTRMSLPIPASFIITPRTPHLAALKALYLPP